MPASAPVTPHGDKKIPGLKRAATTNALLGRSNGVQINSEPILINKNPSNYAKLPGFGM